MYNMHDYFPYDVIPLK